MPDLPSRREHEAAIVALLWDDFQEFGVSRDKSWSSLGVRVQDNLQGIMADVFVAAAENLASSQGVTSESFRVSAEAAYYSRQWSSTVATGIVDSALDAIAAGSAINDVLTKERAEKIAATEVTRAITAGEEAALVLITLATGTSFKPIWVTEKDERVCQVCAPLDGTGDEVFGAVSPSGPPAHPNCRCFLDYEEVL